MENSDVSIAPVESEAEREARIGRVRRAGIYAAQGLRRRLQLAPVSSLFREETMHTEADADEAMRQMERFREGREIIG